MKAFKMICFQRYEIKIETLDVIEYVVCLLYYKNIKWNIFECLNYCGSLLLLVLKNQRISSETVQRFSRDSVRNRITFQFMIILLKIYKKKNNNVKQFILILIPFIASTISPVTIFFTPPPFIYQFFIRQIYFSIRMLIAQ